MNQTTELPAAVPVPQWPSENRDESTFSTVLKYAGPTTAELRFGASDIGHKIDAPEGTRFVNLYGSVSFDGDDWRVHQLFAVLPDNSVNAVIYHYGGVGQDEGYYRCVPASANETGFNAYLWNRFRSNCTPSVMSDRGVSDLLLKSYAAPLFRWLAGLAADYAHSELFSVSLAAQRVQEVNRRANSYNVAAKEASDKLAEYRDALARSEMVEG